MNRLHKIAVIGAGSWGTALSMVLATRECEVVLWTPEEAQARQLAETRRSPVLSETAAPLALASEHGLSQSQIALFALVGAVGAVAAPIAGRLADAGHARAGSLLALLLAPAALLLGLTVPGYSVIGLGLTGVLLDFAVQMNMVIGQREVYALDPASRGRLNAVYMTSIFLGGALGSAVASALFSQFGWQGVALVGAGLPSVALVVFLLKARRG